MPKITHKCASRHKHRCAGAVTRERYDGLLVEHMIDEHTFERGCFVLSNQVREHAKTDADGYKGDNLNQHWCRRTEQSV